MVAEPWPVVGRDADCAAIVTGLRNGTGTVIVGEAGVGKSTLARMVAGQLRAEGWRVALVLSGGRAVPAAALTSHR